MSRFSERMGIKSVKSVLQVDSMDEDLRVGLWNTLLTCIWSRMLGTRISQYSYMRVLFQQLWLEYFKFPLDEMEDYWDATYERIKDYFFDCKWYEAYDFVEFVAKNYPDESDVIAEFIDSCNEVLKNELSAYRFVGCEIAPITSEEEIVEIEEALSLPDALSPVKAHLKDALEKFADRESPDYSNSIKESITAVEALCQLITGDTDTDLGKCLKHIDDKVPLHGALKEGFRKLYAYTSSAEGIRHALLEQPTLDFEDAKFMLVSCSAFINYLVEKASKAGIEF